jgi:hypothetical protein
MIYFLWVEADVRTPTFVMFTAWEIWQEQNARFFRRKLSLTFIILDKIKFEARLWVIVGAKAVGRFDTKK